MYFLSVLNKELGQILEPGAEVSKMAKTEATKSQHCRQNQSNQVWQV